MTSLDLSKAAPRSPKAELDGLIFLPRSIDKIRATLPGGELGEYSVPGFTEMMLEKIGVGVADFTTCVAGAKSDDDVVAFLRMHADKKMYGEWNAFISARLSRGGNRAEAEKIFPWLHERPDLTIAIDILEEDDKRSFA